MGWGKIGGEDRKSEPQMNTDREGTNFLQEPTVISEREYGFFKLCYLRYLLFKLSSRSNGARMDFNF